MVSKTTANESAYLWHVVECLATCCNTWKYKIAWLHRCRKKVLVWRTGIVMKILSKCQCWKIDCSRSSPRRGGEALFNLRNVYIKFPITEVGTQVFLETFQDVSDLPNVGAIDRSHIRIAAPPDCFSRYHCKIFGVCWCNLYWSRCRMFVFYSFL